MNDKTLELQVRTKKLALRIIKLYRSLPPEPVAQVIGRQILRSGTSVGANYRAACRSRSRAEFVAKICIVLEEADETAYWLELLEDGGVMKTERLTELNKEVDELVRIFSASRRTARGK